MGRADMEFGNACELRADAGLSDLARCLQREIVGSNAFDRRSTFQIVEEFDDLDYEV